MKYIYKKSDMHLEFMSLFAVFKITDFFNVFVVATIKLEGFGSIRFGVSWCVCVWSKIKKIIESKIFCERILKKYRMIENIKEEKERNLIECEHLRN